MRGYFGIGVMLPKCETNVGTLWRSAYNMGAAYVFTVQRRYSPQASDTTQSWRHLPLYHYSELVIPYSCQLVGVEITADARDLVDFIHPERAMYLLGPEDGSIPARLLQQCTAVVKIPSQRCLNVAVAGSIVMYDRMLKERQLEPYKQRTRVGAV